MLNKLIINMKICLCTLLRMLTKKEIFVDITGIILTPGNCGKDCNGNGRHTTIFGKEIECCCDECSYMMNCLISPSPDKCSKCTEENCPYFPIDDNFEA